MIQFVLKDRPQLVLEKTALRHQLAVYKRSVKRPNINDGDRIFWLTVMHAEGVANPTWVRTFGLYD